MFATWSPPFAPAYRSSDAPSSQEEEATYEWPPSPQRAPISSATVGHMSFSFATCSTSSLSGGKTVPAILELIHQELVSISKRLDALEKREDQK